MSCLAGRRSGEAAAFCWHIALLRRRAALPLGAAWPAYGGVLRAVEGRLGAASSGRNVRAVKAMAAGLLALLATLNWAAVSASHEESHLHLVWMDPKLM